MSDINYDRFQKLFSYLEGKDIISLEESTDLLTEYLQNGHVTFDNITDTKRKEAKDLFSLYSKNALNI